MAIFDKVVYQQLEAFEIALAHNNRKYTLAAINAKPLERVADVGVIC